MNKQRVLQALENVKSNPYGKWGILNIEQRRFIKELCNSWLILDDATNKQQEEIERLNKALVNIKELVVNNACLSESDNKCIDDLIYYKCDELLDIVNKALGSDKE